MLVAKWLGNRFTRGKSGQIFLSGFRGFSYLVAVAQIIILSPLAEVSPETYILLGLVGAYTVAKILVPFRWYQRDFLTYLVLGTDVLACASVPFFTGGLASGFLLYSFNPILTAALLLQRRVAFSAAAFSCLSITASQLLSSGMNLPITLIPTLPSGYLGTLIIYIMVCFLAALLPFIINANAYRRIEEKATIDERNRLAREMHDNLAQGLGYLKLKTKLVKDSLVPEQPEQAMAELNDMKLIIDSMYADLRESLGLLRVRTLDSIGFMATLADYVHEFSQRSGIKSEMFVADGQTKFSTLAELQVLRLVQEALTNVRKHAKASKVEVRFEADGNWVKVSIGDNGRGFDLTAYQSQEEGGEHIGLKVMRERVESLSGSMSISSSRHQGTTVSFRIPVGRGGG
jgi:signal transduction histidine kinase